MMILFLQILETHDKVAEKTEIYVPLYILPLDSDSANQAIMRYPEVTVKLHSCKYKLPLLLFVTPEDFHGTRTTRKKKTKTFWTGFQLDERALTDVVKKLFKSYKKWCKFLGRKSSLWLPTIQQEVQQRKLLYMGLYLLIWGEAANLRFMPECLRYIYHHVYAHGNMMQYSPELSWIAMMMDTRYTSQTQG